MRAQLVALGCCLGLVGCIRPYKPPTAEQPHAVVKLRRSYDSVAGVSLREYVNIEEHSALREVSPSRVAATPQTDSLLVHPVPQTVEAGSDFFHTELRSVQESYQDCHTTYRMESYDCSSGFGTNKSYRTCTRSVPDRHCQTRWRTVLKNVEVSDGSCARQLRFAPRNQSVYLLQYTYSAPGVCALSCFEQLANADGSFQNQSCPPAPPAEK